MSGWSIEKGDLEEKILKGYNINRRETEETKETVLKSYNSVPKSGHEETITKVSRPSDQAVDIDSDSDIEEMIGGSSDKSDLEEKVYKGCKYIIRRETEETIEPVLKGSITITKSGQEDTRKYLKYPYCRY